MVRVVSFILFAFSVPFLKAQSDSAFLVQNISVEGNLRTNEDAIIILSGLKINEWLQVPGVKTVLAIKKLWDTGDFKNIEIYKKRISSGIELIIKVEEYYLLGDVYYNGLTKSEQRKVKENPLVEAREIYNSQTLHVIENEIKSYLEGKGYLLNKVDFDSVKTHNGYVNFTVNVTKGSRYRVDKVEFTNTGDLKLRKLQNNLKSIHARKFFVVPGTLYENNAFSELENILYYCRNNGYPYAKVEVESVLLNGSGATIMYELSNMDKYLFDSFIWEGNKLFSDSILNSKIENLIGENYNFTALQEALYFSDNYSDVSSLYYDQGYANILISYRLVPKDSGHMDVRIIINEGKEMKFGNVAITGNVRTKDQVIRRDLLTIPGDQFSRSAIFYSQRKLLQLDYFKANKMDVKMKMDTAIGTVDLTYVVEEKISDRLLLSGGYGGNNLVGTLGFDFKNFSRQDLFKKGVRWNPLPAGGGQHLSLKGQSDGHGYYGASFSYFEPWFRGKPVGASVASSYANITDSVGNLNVFNSALTLSHMPFQNKFTYINYELSYKRYNAYDYNVFGERKGHFNALSFQMGFLKNTVDNSFFPTTGNYIKGVALTSLPPYSRYSSQEALELTTIQKFRWFEYYKLKFSFKNYLSLNPKKDWVLASSFGAGYLGAFNRNVGTVPFQRYEMGGTGMSNYSITTNDFIGLRGFDAGEISTIGGDAFAIKYTFELRKMIFQLDKYMLSSHLFFEGGNTHGSINEVNLFGLNNSIGLGAKLYAPVIGVVGVDLGWGYTKSDFTWKIPSVQFTIGLNIGDF